MNRSRAIFLLIGFVLVAPGHAQSIFTVAGGGSDDGRPATVAVLAHPLGIAVDSSGNLYVADTGSSRVRKVSAATGIMTTVAGTGAYGFSGDGGPATAASLAAPVAVFLDASGNLYIADGGNNERVRMVSAATGVITTVAGDGTSGFLRDAGPATAAQLYFPRGIALDGSGNLYIADSGNNRIRKVDAATGVITTVVGSGPGGPAGHGGGFSGDGGPATAALLSFPGDIVLDGSRNLYIADSGNSRIRKVTAATGIIATVVGSGSRFGDFSGDGGPATAAALNRPEALALDGSGNLYIADTGNQRIRKVSAGIITTIAGTTAEGFSGDGGPATAASLEDPYDVALDSSGNFYIADESNNRIRKVSAATGIITTIAGSGIGLFPGDGGPATAATLFSPAAVTADGAGNLYIAEDRIRKVDSATGIITTVAGTGTPGFSGDGGPATLASFEFPADITLDGAGNLYVADSNNERIRKVIAATGIITTVAGSGTRGFSGDGGPATAASFSFPLSVAVDGSGNLYIADSGNHRIRKVTAATGIITTVAGNGRDDFSFNPGPATAVPLRSPGAVAVDSSGNFYIVDGWHRVRKVTAATGVLTTVAGSFPEGSREGDGVPATTVALFSPVDVAVDGSGNFYIADTGNERVRKVTAATGILTTVAGSGVRGFSGDGGPARAASLSGPSGVALDGSGNLYVADNGSNRIRAVFACVIVDSPRLTSPADGSTGVSASPRLAWNAVRGAFRYDVLVDTISPPKQVVASDIATTTFSPANLEPLKTYSWQVVAKGDPFCIPFLTSASPIRTFTTAAACNTPGSFDGTSP